ncbi:hypothetical protein HYT23_03310 [Candidatus Pacearchaeota archaeon]|nr:hypothetical protein [Candidatus Pacearchaeota archaeon]
MVVSPKQLEERVKQKVSQEAEMLERKIDEMLERQIMARGSTNSSIWIDSEFSGVTPYTVQVVIEKYKTFGWDVKYHSDQRDGASYEFKVKHDFHDGGIYDR